MFESPMGTPTIITAACPEERAYLTRTNNPKERQEEEGRNPGEEEDGRPKEKTSKDPVETGPHLNSSGPENKIRGAAERIRGSGEASHVPPGT
ncbi:hypothetical protein NDU88_007124 [Pleurodeles waltl]|uniref:Uncharacterized protein n=1 Tax=Pleurodeles waltl TaxID=8319 RepID=A0AAV7RRG4_PLEWA|nr:hypothetical protein NDU88_007124 [Pleurodeles waltl]